MKKTEQTIAHYSPAESIVVPKGSYQDFMCRCTKESEQECDDCLKRVTDELINPKHPVDIISAVVMSLTWGFGTDDFYGVIDMVGADQWFGISASIYKHGVEEPIAGIWVPCDQLPDGFARVWELAKEAVKEYLNAENTPNKTKNQ